jgi:hypothetical protein
MVRLLLDVSNHAGDMGFDAALFASAAVMQAHGAGGIRAIVVLLSTPTPAAAPSLLRARCPFTAPRVSPKAAACP